MTILGNRRAISVDAEPAGSGKVQGTMLDARRANAIPKERANKNARRLGEFDEAVLVVHLLRCEPLPRQYYDEEAIAEHLPSFKRYRDQFDNEAEFDKLENCEREIAEIEAWIAAEEKKTARVGARK
jgi:hypothetical protein